MPRRACLAIVALALALLTTSAPRAQAPATTNTPEARLAAASNLIELRRHADAIPIAEAVLQEARTLRQESLEAQALALLARAQFQKGDYAATRARGLEAFTLAERLGEVAVMGRAAYVVSTAEELSGDRPAAVRWATTALEHYTADGNTVGQIQARVQLDRAQPLDLERSRRVLSTAADDARAAGASALHASIVNQLGDFLFSAGRLDEAFETLTEAARLRELAGDIVGQGTVHNSLGRVYRAHGRLQEALAQQKAALALHEKAGESFALMQSLNAVGAVYQMLGDIPRAREYTERAAVVAADSGSPRIRDFLQANLASLLSSEGEFARAATILEGVIARGVDTNLAVRFGQLSGAYRGLGRGQDALTAAQQQVERCGNVDTICINALATRADAHALLGDRVAAAADVDAALARLEALRTRLVPSDFFKQDFHRLYEPLYGHAVAVQTAAGNATQAIETAERSRARAFLDLLASRAIDAGSSASAVTATPATASSLASTAARLSSTMLSYWVADDAVFVFVVSPGGAVSSRRVAFTRAKLTALVQATSPLLETSGSDTAAAPMITTRGAASLPTRAVRAGAWRELHARLIEPVRGLLPTKVGALLTIVPHGPLVGLSFAGLQDRRGRYLLEDFTLHYAPAGALLDFTEARRRGDARSAPMLLVADPDVPRGGGADAPLRRLPGARREAVAIARVAGAGHSGVTTLVGGDATHARVRDAARGKAVLHFATHGIVRDDAPFASYLALGGSNGHADGRLRAEDIYAMPLDADLVVLSACRSAAGTVTGDGVSTFARAFLSAGAASLLASLWDVADEPTSRLVADFYRGWLGGADKAQALRAAQLALLRDLRAGRMKIDTPVGPVALPEHPVFWAGFGLFGEPR